MPSANAQMKAQESRHVINVNEYLRLLVDSFDFKSASLKDKEVCGDLCDDAKEHGGLFSSNVNTRVPSISADSAMDSGLFRQIHRERP